MDLLERKYDGCFADNLKIYYMMFKNMFASITWVICSMVTYFEFLYCFCLCLNDEALDLKHLSKVSMKQKWMHFPIIRSMAR